MVPQQVYFFFFKFAFYRTNITEMILYRLYTLRMHLNKDSSDYFACVGGRAVEHRKKRHLQASDKSKVNKE